MGKVIVVAVVAVVAVAAGIVVKNRKKKIKCAYTFQSIDVENFERCMTKMENDLVLNISLELTILKQFSNTI